MRSHAFVFFSIFVNLIKSSKYYGLDILITIDFCFVIFYRRFTRIVLKHSLLPYWFRHLRYIVSVPILLLISSLLCWSVIALFRHLGPTLVSSFWCITFNHQADVSSPFHHVGCMKSNIISKLL